MEPRTEVESDGHPLVLSFMAVRRIIGYLGIALPLLLVPTAWGVYGVPLQNNLSLYYHTPVRDLFVGVMCAIGLFFFVYRGRDRVEDWSANLACLFAVGLAFFPVDPAGLTLASSPGVAPERSLATLPIVGVVHNLCGMGFFLTLAFYSLFHFPSVQPPGLPGRSIAPDPARPVATPPSPEPPERHPAQRDFLYRLSGATVLASMALMGVYVVLFALQLNGPADRIHALLWLEWLAVWAFAGAWLLKGRVIGADLTVELVALAQRSVQHFGHASRENVADTPRGGR
jgi:hypothetical protein